MTSLPDSLQLPSHPDIDCLFPEIDSHFHNSDIDWCCQSRPGLVPVFNVGGFHAVVIHMNDNRVKAAHIENRHKAWSWLAASVDITVVKMARLISVIMTVVVVITIIDLLHRVSEKNTHSYYWL